MSKDHRFTDANPCLSLKEAFPELFAVEIQATQWQVALDGDFERRLVWESEIITDGRCTTRVGPVDGRFCGGMTGSVLLDLDTNYTWRARFRTAEGWDGWSGPIPLRIVGRTILSDDFREGPRGTLTERIPTISPGLYPQPWQVRGCWKLVEGGLTSCGQDAELYAVASAHGIFTCRFHVEAEGTISFGLIVRHYNAHRDYRLLLTREENSWRLGLFERTGLDQGALTGRFIKVTKIPALGTGEHELMLCLNGDSAEAWLDGVGILECKAETFGQVENVGLSASGPGVIFRDVRFRSGYHVARQVVRGRHYEAVIRPGNIGEIYFPHSDKPHQNICWDSGLQFGHIGGSEIKGNVDARLRVIESGPVLTLVRWSGTMPYSADQRTDIRGQAWGWAAFYPDRIVVADFVVPFAPRSVGPDYDLAAWLLDDSYRYACGPDGEFIQKTPSSGRSDDPRYYLDLGDQPALPILVQVPLKLGDTRCWWTALAFDLLNLSGRDDPTVAFDWITKDRLTLSIDLRKMPPTPAVLYGWGIVLWFDPPEPDGQPERALARRDAYLQPMKLRSTRGSSVSYDRNSDHPAAALFLDRGFHRGYGAYLMKPDPHGRIEVHLNPGEHRCERPVFRIEDVEARQAPEVIWDGRTLSSDEEFSCQSLHEGGCLIRLAFDVERPAELRIAFP